MVEKLNKFFTADIQTDDHLTLRRVIVLNAYLIISVIVFVVFSYINFAVRAASAVAVLDVVAAIISIIALYDLHRNRSMKRPVMIGTVNMLLFFLLFTYVNQNSSFGLIWLIFLPIFVITLNGHQRGVLLALVWYAIVLVIAYHGIGIWQDGTWDTISFVRLAAALLTLIGVYYAQEYSLYRSEKLLEANRVREQEYLVQLEHLSHTDALTQLYNRRKVDQVLEREIERSRRYEHNLALIIMDLDDFKSVNDRFGHTRGDQVLQEVSGLIVRTIRQYDIAARWGGEEFIIVCPQTDLDEAVQVAERVRRVLEDTDFSEVGTVQGSFGVTVYTPELDKDTFIGNVDSALYRAKENGKNTVLVYEHPEAPACMQPGDA